MTRQSHVDESMYFSKDTWVVSLINPHSGIEGMIAGHLEIVVEGFEANGDLFVGQYDVGALPTENPSFLASIANNKGVIHKVRVYENHITNPTDNNAEDAYTNPKGDEYYHSRSRSFAIAAANVRDMLESIHADAYRVNEEQNYIPYQAYGSEGGILQWFFSDSDEVPEFGEKAINCAEWCHEKLRVAGVEIDCTPKPHKSTKDDGCRLS